MRWLVLLLFLPTGVASPQLTGLVADLEGAGDGQEGVAISCVCNLAGYQLTDGEGTWTFPADAWLDGEAWIVGNPAEWYRFDGPEPRWLFDLQLGNGGDDVRLLNPDGVVVDAFDYGSKGGPSYTDANLIYRPGQGDWVTPRMHRMGESSLGAPVFEVDALTAYASPDSSHEVLTDLLDSARVRVHLHVYELQLASLVDHLVAAGERGVDLQVLVEDNPVGLQSDGRAARAEALHRIQEAGGDAWFAGSGRYAFHHLKVLVVDDAVAVQSENWVASGVPENPTTGNRGWGVVLHDGEAADWFADWMAEDRAAWDTTPFRLDEYDPWHEAPPRYVSRTGDYDPVPAKRFEGPISVQPFISPDTTAEPDAEFWGLMAASNTLRIQQLDLRTEARNSLGWQADDPLWLAAAGENRDVRVMAASPFHRDDTGNREALASLASRGVLTKELDRPGLGTLHNKGVIGDDWVFFGSMNGNHHSRSNNREASVLIQSPEVAAYYAGLFDADWEGADSRDWSVPLDDLESIPAPLPILLVALLVAGLLCSRLSPGSRS